MTISKHLNKCNKRHAPRLRYPTYTSTQALLHRIQELGWHYDGKIAPRVRLFVCANGRNGGDDTCGV